MTKPSNLLTSQVDLLESRGLLITEQERPTLNQFLLNVNFHRASGYWKYFQKKPQTEGQEFLEGTELGKILKVYDFDQGLRYLLLQGVSIFEVSFRSRFAHFYSEHCGGKSWLSSAMYKQGRTPSAREDLLPEVKRELARSREIPMDDYRNSPEEIPL